MYTDGHGLERTEFGDALTEGVIGAAFEIANVLGAGFLEKVYERAFLRELALRGLNARSQVSFSVCYKGQYVGEYVADLLVENKLIVELKCVGSIIEGAPGAVYQLPESFAYPVSVAHQLSKAEDRMEACCLRSVKVLSACIGVHQWPNLLALRAKVPQTRRLNIRLPSGQLLLQVGGDLRTLAQHVL